MGCDIHLHIELKIGGQWQHYAAPQINRWYDLFGVMADVRGCGPAIIAPKGLPEDLSVITAMSYKSWGSDAHTPSWFNLEEIKLLSKWLKKREEEVKPQWPGYGLEHAILNCYLFGCSFSGLKEYPEDYPKEIEDVRFVFWFDN